MAANDSAGRRRALLVAADTYADARLADLRAPIGDVGALASVLGDPTLGGFELRRLVNRPTEETKREIEGFFLEGARLHDLLLLYMSGHGVLSQTRKFYFATTSTDLRWLGATAIEDRFVRDLMEDSRARSIVLIVDCCHSGAFVKGLVPKSAPVVDVVPRFEGRGRVTLTASTELEYAFEEVESGAMARDLGASPPGSLFTRFLVEGIQTGSADLNQDGKVSIDEVYDYVFAKVRERTQHQTPGKGRSGYGDLIIATSPRGASLPLALRQALENPLPSVREAAIADLARMSKGASPVMAVVLRNALRDKLGDDSLKVQDAAAAALQHLNDGEGEPPTEAAEDRKPPVWPRDPRLAGDPRVGQQLSVIDLPEPGEVTLSYEWQRELGDRTQVFIPDALDLHYELRSEDLGCRVRARITARGTSERSVAYTDWSATVTSRSPAPAPVSPLRLTEARAAGAAAVGGAIAAIASVFLEDSDRWLAWVWYEVPVALMSVGVILLIGFAFGSDRRALLLAATGLALVLLGVAFPMSYRPGPLPRTVGFWLGACGAAVAVVGAAFAARLAYPEAPTAGAQTSSPTPSRVTRAAFALSAPMIVIASLFVLPEWADRHRNTTWINWRHDLVLRYPAAIILLCGVTMALAVWGIRVNRRRLLVIGAGVGCLVLGEAVPLIFTDPHEPGPWGSGRWLRIVGAVFTIAGLAAAGAMTRRDAPTSRRYG